MLRNRELGALIGKYTHLSQENSKEKTIIYSADDVRLAIAHGELTNYYQPKVAVASGRVVGVQTLVRWNHPLDGVIFPDQLSIPLKNMASLMR